MTDPTIGIRHSRLSKARWQIVLTIGEKVLFDDKLDLISRAARTAFVAAAIKESHVLFQHRDAIEAELDKLAINAATPAPEKADAPQGSILAFETVEPWPELVAGDGLLDAVAALLRRYLVLPEHGFEAVTLWIAHTYSFTTFEHTPRLGVTSPTRRCGKTTLLTALEMLVCRPMFGSHLTAATVFRAVEQYRPTLLVDEADTFLKDNDELRGVLNSGHARNGRVPRCVPVGDRFELAMFSTFSPVAIACIGELPGTLADRAIPLRLRRKTKTEQVAKLRPREIGDELTALRRKLTRWCGDHCDKLGAARPAMPAELNDRAEDGWTPLLALADMAGGAWPARGRAAAVALNGDEEEDGTRSLLLADLRDLCAQRAAEDLLTEQVLAHLHALPERPWRTFSKGRPLTDRQLASNLRTFGVRSRDVWTPVGARKGYSRAALEEVFARYLPNRPPRDAMPRDPAPDLGNPANVIRESSERLAVGEHPGPRAEPGLSRHRGSEGPVEYEL